jgi:hypothetical protein
MERAGASKTPLHEMDLKVAELHVNGAGKFPDASSDRHDWGILNNVGFNASDQETSLSAVDGSPGSPPMSARIDRSRIQQSFL